MNASLLNRKPLPKTVLAGVLLALVAVGLLATSVNGYRGGDWFVADALKYAEWAVYVALASSVLLVAGVFAARAQANRRAVVMAVQCLLLTLPIVCMAAYYEVAARIHPPINDISTDLQDPPLFWDMPNPMDHPGETVAGQQRAAYPDIAPLVLESDPEKVHALALELARERRWEIVADVPEDGRIEAVVSSFLYGFKDEIVIRIQANGDGSVVDMRSRSRVGRIDRGVNAKRIRAFLSALEDRAQG